MIDSATRLKGCTDIWYF